jgi:radical SAM-linked protein
VRYTKLGRIRWISHRDVARALERALRVAQVPLAFTEGFVPRPRVSFGLALSTGHESEAEYLDLVLAGEYPLDALPGALSDALPDGIDVVGAVPLVDRAPALQEAVTSVEWQVDVLPVTDLDAAVAAGLDQPALETTRRRKGREVVEDVRPVLRSIVVNNGTSVHMELHTQPRSAKPGEVLAAIGQSIGVELIETRAIRTQQWIERDGARHEPLDADTRPRVPEARAS